MGEKLQVARGGAGDKDCEMDVAHSRVLLPGGTLHKKFGKETARPPESGGQRGPEGTARGEVP